MPESGTWRGRLRRWRWIIAAIVVLVGLRVALPEILRRVIVSQAMQNLRADVDLGNVDLYLYRGGVVLEDFALRPKAPVAEAAAAGTATPEPEATPRQPPIVAFKRLSVGLRFRPLWDKTIQLYELSLVSPEIALDRLESGELNVQTILPQAQSVAAGSATPPASPPPPATPTASGATTPAGGAAPESAWKFGIDHTAIGEGRLVFRDLMLPGSEPVEVGIPSIEVDDVALDPSVYGGPLNTRVKILLDDGSLELGARLGLAPGKTTLKAELEAHDLPLRRSRLYIPEVGWSDLRGLLDASLEYELVTGEKNEVRGSVGLRDVFVAVPDLPEAALVWKSLSVRVDPIDVQAQTATVTSVDLDGAVLTVEPTGSNQLPVLTRIRAKAAAAPAESEAAAESPTPSESPGGAAEAEATPAAAQAEATPSEAEAPAKPWHWSLASLSLSNSIVRRLADGVTSDIGVAAKVQSLSDHGSEPASVDLQVQLAGGSLAVQGKARIEPPGFGGTVTLRDLSIPDLITMSAALPDSPLRSAQLAADLEVAAGLAGPSAKTADVKPADLRVVGKIDLAQVGVTPPGMKDGDVGVGTISLTLSALDLAGMLALGTAEAPPPDKGDVHFQGELSLGDAKVALAGGKDLVAGAKAIRLTVGQLDLPAIGAPASVPARPDKGDVHFQGDLSLNEPKVALADGKEFAAGAKAIRLAVGRLDLPGIAAPPSGAAKPMVAEVKELRLDAPAVRITRTEKGLVLPAAAAPPAGSEPAKAAPAPATNQPPAEPAPAPSPATNPAQFSMALLALKDGRVDISDRSLKPPFNGALTGLEVEARDVRWPDVAVRKLRFFTHTPGNGEIEVTGGLAAGGGALQIDLRQVDLPSLNPYASTYSPFRLDTGALSLSTKVSFSGSDYDLGNSITLHDLGLSGKEGESVFEEQFGVPLSTALALLRDAKGDISMDVPVKVGKEGTTIDIWTVAGGALRSALVNALTSPLRLLGAVTGSGGQVASIAPAAIAFRTGQAEPRSEAEGRLDQLGAFLASRPSIAVELETQVTQSDVRWLHEQALLHTWDEQGFFASMLALVEGDTRDRVRKALEARASGDVGKLSEEDTASLDEWLAKQPPPSPEQIDALGRARLSRTETALRAHPGVDAARVGVLPLVPDLADGDAEVRARLRPAGASPAEQPAGG